ncbi:hypothetical protein COLO4_29530 [Corchorus olitorius]|uniref:Uncharacterized protein n=1 Tax=Corchorus olitorius TaxID=93759 RepID=A0A1R3HE65_9ROSI|nr:hypothetical protein COLO4_29530 [Corchorus olitorius]
MGIQFRIPVSIETSAAGEENLIMVAESERKSDNISGDVLIFDKGTNASGNEKITTDHSIELVHEKSMALESEEFNEHVGFQIEEEEMVMLSMELNIVEKENDLQLAVLEENGNIQSGQLLDFIGLDVTNLENGPSAFDVDTGYENEESRSAYNSLDEEMEMDESSPIVSEYRLNKMKRRRGNKGIRLVEEQSVKNRGLEKWKKKRGKKGVMKLIYKEKFQEELNSDVSISNEEINHRNMVLLKEA